MKPTSVLLLCTILCTAFSFTHGSAEVTQECLKKYLSDVQVTEEVLDYVDRYVGSITDCKKAVNATLESFHKNIRDRLMNDRKIRTYVECIMRDVEEEDAYEEYEIISLREMAVEMISNWRFWSYFSKSSRLDEIRAEKKSKEDDLVTRSLLKCKGHREFGDLFTSINEQSITWARNGDQEYCIRKKLVDTGMINPRSYQFRPNPKNVKIESLDCEKVFNDVVDNFYSEIKKSKIGINDKSEDEINECLIDAFRKNGYAENILKAELLSKLKLERWDKTKEKQNFINSMVDATYEARKC